MAARTPAARVVLRAVANADAVASGNSSDEVILERNGEVIKIPLDTLVPGGGAASGLPPLWTNHGTDAGEQLFPLGHWLAGSITYWTTTNFAANDFIMWPMMLPRAATLDEIRQRLVDGDASHLVNYGIYSSLPAAGPYPDALLWSVNSVTANADAIYPVDLDLVAGRLYWLAMHNKGATQYERIEEGALCPVFGVNPATWASTSGFVMGGPGFFLRGAVAFADMPATAPALAIRYNGETKLPPVLLGKFS